MTKGKLSWKYNSDTKDVTLRNEFKLEDGWQLGVTHESKGSPVAFDLEKKPFRIEHNAQKQTWAFQYKEDLKVGTFRIKQEVKSNKVEASPLVELTGKLKKKGSVQDSFKVAYDYGKHEGTVEETLLFNNSRQQAKVAANTSDVKKATVTLTSKFDYKYLTSLSVSYSKPKGVGCVWETAPVKGLKVKADTNLNSKVSTITASYKPSSAADDVELLLEYVVPLDQPNSSKAPKLGASFGFSF